MKNDKIQVLIDTCDTSSEFGMICSLTDIARHVTVGENRLFRLRAGTLTAYKKNVLHCSNDTISVLLDRFSTKKFKAVLEYTLTANGVRLQIRIICYGNTDFTDGLNLDFTTSLSQLKCWNHLASNGLCFDLDTLRSYMSAIDFNQFIQLHDSSVFFTLLVRNPFHSHFAFNVPISKQHTFYILQLSANPSEAGTPNAYSTINAGDTIYRDIEIYADNKTDAPVIFSEQPDGFSNSITMFWDELPNRDNWSYMTSDTATDTRYYRYFVKLLKAFPTMKMGFLLLPDRIISPATTTFDNWAVNSPYVMADTIERHSGNSSVYMICDTICSLVAYQKVYCQPNTAYSLTCYMKTDYLVGNGAYCEIYADTHWIAASPHLKGNNDWQINGFDFKTSKQDTALTIYVRMENSRGRSYFDDVNLSLVGQDNNLVSNPGFENATYGVIYDNKRRHWSDAHGAEHIISKAPKEYMEFLQRIENHIIKYGWEDRVKLGSHGYHHTPSLFEPDPEHEFYYYDPQGDSLRISRIFSELYQMGLTDASFRFMRSPGFKFSKSLLDLLVDNKVVFFDFPNCGGLPFSSCMLKRGKNQLWLIKNSWWADYESNGDPTTRLYDVLNRGHIGVIGGHPENIFYNATEESYERLKSIFSSIETSFPNLGYLFPDAYADNAQSIYNLFFVKSENDGKNIVFHFNGFTDSGNTVIYLGTCDNVLLNGKPANFRIFNNATYAILPATTTNSNTVTFINAIEHTQTIRQDKNTLPYNNSFSKAGNYVTVFNLRGQKICTTTEKDVGNFMLRYYEYRQNLPGGVYIVKSGGTSKIFSLPY